MKEAKHKRPHSASFHLYEMPRTGKSMGTETRLMAAVGEVGERGVTINRYRDFGGVLEMF